MTHLAKGAIATSSLGTIVTGAYIGSSYLSKKSTISDHLTHSNYQLISSISNKDHSRLQWEAEFESDKDKIKGLIGFTEDDKKKGGEALERWCSSKLKESYSEEHKDLERIKSYCVIRDISSQLKRKGKSVLSDSDGKWTQTYNKRKSTPKRSPRSQIAGLTGEWNASGVSHSEGDDLAKIKEWCKLTSQSSFRAYETTYDQVYNWCTEDGTSVAEISG
ncbi:hypothetical protein MHC_01735 [Mycoplasma haemocanis str. Illinois]|uniref:Uncharacterized protein n=1 Tax=Mycoplasma haemocanis (strain Illinois) TaxID=1111676 RepID=H6N6E1_MYCHN|nr:hypothetical protein [Mycoplasma haemocanis]AEW45213.1 hypothetical protein MHC_01735 [Mycoplasma haemocanis str. Illinois]